MAVDLEQAPVEPIATSYGPNTGITDWSTIVSIVPLEIKESKPGLNPGYFHIPACTDTEKPVVHHVCNAFHNIYLDEDRGHLPQNNESAKVARSVVFDYINSQLAVTDTAMPGLFWVPGKLSAAEVKTKFSDKLVKAKVMQNNWFEKILVITKDQWARYHNYLAISDFQRTIAKAVNLNPDENPWMDPANRGNTNICPACDFANPKRRVVCQKCQCILDETRYASLKFAK